MDDQPLLGRTEESGTIARLIDGVRRGRGSALVVHGEAGVGKSALIAHALEAASDGMIVLKVTGLPSEAQLGFAGLHQVLRPILADLGRLPGPQRTALEAAFGLVEPEDADRFLIAMGTVTLLSERAAIEPVLLVVEDAQWLDRPSAETLAFAARRLPDDAIGLIASFRDGWPSPLLSAGLPSLRVLPLDADDSATLLDRRAPDLAPVERTRILQIAAGNPLALMELPVDASTPPRVSRHGEIPINARLERAFTDRIDRLAGTVRTALVVAAADDADDVREIVVALRAIDPTSSPMDDLAAAAAAGLVSIDDDHVTFRHPLMRTATYQAAAPATRSAAHAALAVALAANPDRAVWHRAASAGGPDAEIADGLAQAASRARRRGAAAVAVAALERSVRLTPDPQTRVQRRLEAAEIGLEMGRTDLLDQLGLDTEASELTPRNRARLALVEEVRGPDLRSAERVLGLVAHADDARAAGEVDLALELLRIAALRTWWSVPDESVGARVATAVDAFDLPAAEPRRLAILAIADPDARAAEVERHLETSRMMAGDDAARLRLVGHAAMTIEDMRSATAVLIAATDLLRPQGRLMMLVPGLTLLAWAALWSGDWGRARSSADEAIRHAEELGDVLWGVSAAIASATIAAVRGETEEADRVLAGIAAIAVAMETPVINGAIERARGVIALAEGRASDAVDHLLRAFDPDGPAFHRYERRLSIGFLAEAAVSAGREAEVRPIMEELEQEAARTTSPHFHASMRTARALLATDDVADELFQAALDIDLGGGPYVRARTELAYGTWLRRQRHVAQSRARLRAARDAFDALGAAPWAERARQELRAAGEASRRREPNAIDALTAQEWQIAGMAAEGLSNREIGERLFLSHRTVAFHLYRIFPKLGITSRGHLAEALGSIPPEASPPSG